MVFLLFFFFLVCSVLFNNLLGFRTDFSLTLVLENEDSWVLTYKEQQSPVSEGFLGGSGLYAKQTIKTRDTTASLSLKLELSKIAQGGARWYDLDARTSYLEKYSGSTWWCWCLWTLWAQAAVSWEQIPTSHIIIDSCTYFFQSTTMAL